MDRYRTCSSTNISQNPIKNAIDKYKNHPVLIAVYKHMKVTSSSFSFQNVTTEKTAKLITNLDNKKVVQSTDIPTKLVKDFGCLFSSFLAFNVSKCINEATNVDAFKKAEV